MCASIIFEDDYIIFYRSLTWLYTSYLNSGNIYPPIQIFLYLVSCSIIKNLQYNTPQCYITGKTLHQGLSRISKDSNNT